MGTHITFSTPGKENKPLHIRVQEGPDDVLNAWTGASGSPFPLQLEQGGTLVYVNPGTVAYWREAAADSEERQARREARRAARRDGEGRQRRD